MNEILTCTVRKMSKSDLAALLLIIPTICFVCLAVNIYVGTKSPMKQYNIHFFIGMVVFFIWWLVIYLRMKLTLHLLQDKNGSFFISIPLKNGTEIKVNKVSAIEPIWSRVFVGKGPKIKSMYLKIYDENGDNSLSLTYGKGAIHAEPDGFWEMDERDFLNYDKGAVVYGCADFQDIYYSLTANKMIEIRKPQG